MFRKLLLKITSSFTKRIERLAHSKFSSFSIITTSGNQLVFNKLEFIQSLKIDEPDKIKDLMNHNFDLLGSGKTKINLNNKIEKTFLGITYSRDPVMFDLVQNRFNTKDRIISTKVFNLIPDDYELIDWQIDFRSGYRWEEKWFKDIDYGNNKSADIKVPWELGRMQHLLSLSLYYKDKREENVANEIINQILDFICQNPPGTGVQWKTSMDVGIRAVNWLLSINILTIAGFEIDENKFKYIKSSIVDHFIHIKSNIEYSEGMRGNHFLSNICSLIVICVFFGKEYKDKLAEYLKAFNKEIDYQFYEDGSNFEASTRYHLLTSEMIFVTINILKCYGVEFNFNENQLENIVRFSKELLSFETVPTFGDHDSGNYIKPFISDANKYELLKKILDYQHNFNKSNSICFSDFGYYRLSNKNFDIIIKNGPVGQNGKGGHAHNDNLSFVMYYKGIQVITDPGTFVYTSNKNYRNKFRSNNYHNVLNIDGEEQNIIKSTTNDDVFWVDSDNSNPIIENFNSNNFKGIINYCGKKYSREIQLFDNQIIIKDSINSPLKKELNIHFSPGIKLNNENEILIRQLKESSLTLHCDYDKKLAKYLYSSEYGKIQEAYRLIASTKNENMEIRIKVSE